MTSREARTQRRAAERKTAKQFAKAANVARTPAPIGFVSQDINVEEELCAQLIAEANALREKVYREAGLDPSTRRGFVSRTATEPSSRAEINRANARHSTGPKSAQGKLASSGNSLKHGLASGWVLIPGEDPAAFQALLHDLLAEHQPASPTEELLVNQMAQSYWLSQRAIRMQNECFTEDDLDDKRLALFLRYQTTHDRAFHKALSTLMKLKKENGVTSGSGFVSQNSLKPAAREVSGHAHPGFVSQNHPDQSGSERFIAQSVSDQPDKITDSLVEAA